MLFVFCVFSLASPLWAGQSGKVCVCVDEVKRGPEDRLKSLFKYYYCVATHRIIIIRIFCFHINNGATLMKTTDKSTWILFARHCFECIHRIMPHHNRICHAGMVCWVVKKNADFIYASAVDIYWVEIHNLKKKNNDWIKHETNPVDEICEEMDFRTLLLLYLTHDIWIHWRLSFWSYEKTLQKKNREECCSKSLDVFSPCMHSRWSFVAVVSCSWVDRKRHRYLLETYDFQMAIRSVHRTCRRFFFSKCRGRNICRFQPLYPVVGSKSQAIIGVFALIRVRVKPLFWEISFPSLNINANEAQSISARFALNYEHR